MLSLYLLTSVSMSRAHSQSVFFIHYTSRLFAQINQIKPGFRGEVCCHPPRDFKNCDFRIESMRVLSFDIAVTVALGHL